jgi:hypothetical protein
VYIPMLFWSLSFSGYVSFDVLRGYGRVGASATYISLQLDMVDIGDGHGFSIIWMESRLACLLMGVFVLNAGFFGAWMDGWLCFGGCFLPYIHIGSGWLTVGDPFGGVMC